ncbi:hypothetical protein IEQ34_017169 [Dendrobium chrysotoxum]|uniref:Uncharacterized protein n=1 Tax=Dendrobium chrysotoxum TaxID=161865 RepID=A0AAV7G9I8_DENCH|nr:hypothetical protein IEQ34_017169 [Dendrobium chrysotoxum]
MLTANDCCEYLPIISIDKQPPPNRRNHRFRKEFLLSMHFDIVFNLLKWYMNSHGNHVESGLLSPLLELFFEPRDLCDGCLAALFYLYVMTQRCSMCNVVEIG